MWLAWLLSSTILHCTVPVGYNLRNAVAFAYDASLAVSENDAGQLKKIVDNLE